MSAPDVVVIDFETYPIENRPHYPPPPVGVAIKWPRQAATYYAFDHPSRNNCEVDAALHALDKVWASGLPVLCHHAKFDLAVAYEQLGAEHLPWDRVHDTMFLAFLCDPHARELGLKELARDMLDMPPDEQDALHGWIWDKRKLLQTSWPQYGTVSKQKAGKWIFATPGDLCGQYGIGDVDRTAALFEKLWPIVQENGMGPAYDRERRLLPILMANEERGMRVDVPALERDILTYEQALANAEGWLRKTLRASGLNFDADKDVAAVLLERGVVDEENWATTKTGQLSMKKDVLLPEMFNDPQIASALGYRNRLVTCLKMFMQPWHAQAVQRKGYISTNWNQTRGAQGGTRTGRPSTSNPNFLNISKDFEGRTDGYVNPTFLGVEPLPLVRKYILPDEGHIFLHRDFDGQELRVFAHFEEGQLYNAYLKDAAMDPHAMIKQRVLELTGTEFERTIVKNINFGKIYGAGVPRIASLLKASHAEAKAFNAIHDQAMPGRKVLSDTIKSIVARGEPIRTWGGRLYFEEPRGPDGRSKAYKTLNYIVQGSAADITKEALIQWSYAQPGGARFLVAVYDEINISAPSADADMHMSLLREIMNQHWLDVPMR